MCNDSIALALIRISSFQIGNDGDYKSILICGLLRECKLKSVNTRGPKSKNKAINTESTFFVESITVLLQQVWKSGGSTERSTPPQSNIRASIPPAKFHHLAGKVSKSCYKLREDRVATHLPTLHWCPQDVMRIIPLLSDARSGKKKQYNESSFNFCRLWTIVLRKGDPVVTKKEGFYLWTAWLAFFLKTRKRKIDSINSQKEIFRFIYTGLKHFKTGKNHKRCLQLFQSWNICFSDSLCWLLGWKA